MADATIYSGCYACLAWVGSVTSILIYLTHWGHDNMAVILQTEFYRFLLWKLSYFYSNFTEISSRAINNRAALAQTIAGCQTGNRPLSEPTMVYFTATYMRHSTSTYIHIYIYIYITHFFNLFTPWFCSAAHNRPFEVFIYHILFHERFSIIIQIRWNIQSALILRSDHYEILHMARQLCCCGMCKSLYLYGTLQCSHTNTHFRSNMNYDGKSFVKSAP